MTELSTPAHRSEQSPQPGGHGPEALRILSAAWAVLRRSHFRSLKIRQVLTASYTSASSFYRLFPSKSHLMLALFENEMKAVDQRLKAVIDPTEPAIEQLRALLRFSLGTMYSPARAEHARLFLDRELIEELPERCPGAAPCRRYAHRGDPPPGRARRRLPPGRSQVRRDADPSPGLGPARRRPRWRTAVSGGGPRGTGARLRPRRTATTLGELATAPGRMPGHHHEPHNWCG